MLYCLVLLHYNMIIDTPNQQLASIFVLHSVFSPRWVLYLLIYLESSI